MYFLTGARNYGEYGSVRVTADELDGGGCIVWVIAVIFIFMIRTFFHVHCTYSSFLLFECDVEDLMDSIHSG